MKTKIYVFIFAIAIAMSVDSMFPGESPFLQQHSPPKSKLEEAENLEQQVSNFYQQGRWAEAIPLAEKVLTIRRHALKSAYLDEAMDINKLAVLYTNCEEYVKAEPLFQQALAIAEKDNPKHPNIARILISLAALYVNRSIYEQVEPLYHRILMIMDTLYGSEYLEIAIGATKLATFYVIYDDYEQADLFFQRTRTIWEQTLGPEQILMEAFTLDKLVRLMQRLYKLAGMYNDRRKYEQAEILYQRALDIAKKALGPEHPIVATILNTLAVLNYEFGDYAQAEPLFQQTLTIREKILPPEDPDIARTLADLATLYNTRGNYAQAEPLLQRALAIDKEAYGLKHPHVAKILTTLALLHYNLGKYEQAESLFQQALTIREKILPSEHLDVAQSLVNLARLYSQLGKYAQAEPLLKQALTISEKRLPPEHPYVIQRLFSLVSVYSMQGKHQEAKLLFHRVQTIFEQDLKKENYTVSERYSLANVSYNLARSYYLLYESPLALQFAGMFFLLALEIVEQTTGKEHPTVAIILTDLAELYVALDNIEQAYKHYKKVQQLDEKLIEQVLGFTSEKDKLAFVIMKQRNVFRFLNLVSQYLSQNPIAKKDAFDVWLRRKGMILKTQKLFQEVLQKRFQEALADGDNPESMHTFQELSRINKQLSDLVMIGGVRAEVYKQQLAKLEAQKDELEARLSKQSQAYIVFQKISNADTVTVAKALPPDTVLLEFARVDMFNFKAKGQEEKWQPAHYFVFILHAGKPEHVRFVDLGEAKLIDDHIAKLRRSIKDKQTDLSVAHTLYQKVFDPLTKELEGVTEIFISPDGNLNLFPFEILIDPDGKYLIEKYTFNYLAAGRDLLGFGQHAVSAQPPLLIGDPDFHLDLSLPYQLSKQERLSPSDPCKTPPSDLCEKENTSTSTSHALTGKCFKRLWCTKDEIEAIYTMFQMEQPAFYTHDQATETVLLNASAPRILHLATHGFFLEDQKLPYNDPSSRSPDLYNSFGNSLSKFQPLPPSISRFVNPLQRSGIVLTGVNPAIKAGRPDGIVTAEKILGLQLQGTEIVVLSACETGLGAIQEGEGIYGLRRAFLQAGAKSLVMSLWSVDDPATKDLMIRFYTNLHSGKMNRVQALREAALEMKKIKPHPYYWGAFVFLGEP